MNYFRNYQSRLITVFIYLLNLNVIKINIVHEHSNVNILCPYKSISMQCTYMDGWVGCWINVKFNLRQYKYLFNAMTIVIQ